MTRPLFRFACPAILVSATFGADSRCIFVLRDVSPSFYQQLPAANHRIQSVVQMCGPDDQLVIIDVGRPFQPKSNVRVQGDMPFSSAPILELTHNIKRWRDNQALLDALWNDVGGKVQAIKKFLDQPVARSNSTDLYGALEYCSLRRKQGHCAEAYISLHRPPPRFSGGFERPAAHFSATFSRRHGGDVFCPMDGWSGVGIQGGCLAKMVRGARSGQPVRDVHRGR